VLIDALNHIGFIRCASDPAVFFNRGNLGLAIIATAVDNLTITATNNKLLKITKNDIKGQFNIKDLGELYCLLNIKIKQDKNMKTIGLSQEAYIDKILKHSNLQDTKAVQMPVDPNTKLNKDQSSKTNEEKDCMRKILYHQAVGSLM
jgi:hypothetical protein